MTDRTVRVRYTAEVDGATTGVARYRRENDRLIVSAERAGKSLDEEAAAVTRLDKSSAKLAATSHALLSARDRLAVAERRLADARKNGNVEKVALAERAVESARRGVTVATLRHVEATNAAAKANEKLAAETDKVDKVTRRASRSTNLLVAAIVGLGPALIPIGAGVVGVAAAFGGMGAAGVAAVVGVKNEMEDGTKVGLEYRASIDGAKKDLQGLAKVAATNVLGSFQDGVADLNRNMPFLRKSIGELATLTGRTGANVFSGAIAGIQTFNPLIVDASVYVERLSERFRASMSGPGVKAFVEYVRSAFPQIVHDTENIVAAAAHLVATLAPLGLGTLSTLSLLATVIRDIPVDVLAQVAQLAGSVYAGFKTWQALSTPVGKLNDLLSATGPLTQRAATAIRALSIASGVIGVALAALTFIMSHNAEVQRENQQAVDDFADALRASNGVIDESIAKTAAKMLQDKGVLDIGRAYKYNLSDLTQAAIGNADAQARVAAHTQAIRDSMAEASASGTDMSATYGDLGNDLVKVDEVLGTTNNQLQSAVQKNKDLAAATALNAASTSAAATESQRLAGIYGASAGVYQRVVASQKGIADKAAEATLKMQLENDAAGLLRQSLDLLNGKGLSLAAAQTTAASATISLTKSLKDNGTTLATNTEKGIANRQAIEQKIAADQRAAEAVATSTGSTKAGTEALATSKTQLEKTLKSQGLLTAGVQAYIDKLYAVPKKVPPTKLEVDKKEAEAKLAAFQAAINGLHGTTVSFVARWSIPRPPVGTGTVLAPVGYGTVLKANGGLVKAYQAGGIAAGVARYDGGGTYSPDVANAHVPHIAPAGTYRVFGEAETQGEGYVPLANDWRRPRAKAITSAIVNQFGGKVQWNAAGNLTGLGAGWDRSMRVDTRGLAADVAIALRGVRMTLVVDGRPITGIISTAQEARDQRTVDRL